MVVVKLLFMRQDHDVTRFKQSCESLLRDRRLYFDRVRLWSSVHIYLSV
jgi:hypothetical protein